MEPAQLKLDESAPKSLRELQEALDRAGVYQRSQVDRFVELHRGGAGRDLLHPLLDACVAAWEELDRAARVEFRDHAIAFVVACASLSTSSGVENEGWEKLSIFLSFLVPLLPERADELRRDTFRDLVFLDEEDLAKSAEPPGEPSRAEGFGPPPMVAAVEKAPPADTVEFLAVYPPAIPRPGGAQVCAYAFPPSEADEVREDADLLRKEKGPLVHAGAEAPATLARGVVLKVTPQCDGLTFDPPAQSAVWRGHWRRFDFHAAAAGGPAVALVRGRISFTVEGLLVADIPFEAMIGPSATAPSAAETRAVAARLYDSIFPSYSHQDKQIVERIGRAYRALGLTYLRDIATLRSGEAWEPRILELIEQANAFQLFWSRAAAESKYVTEEWQAALQLIAEKKKEETFIRPVYWQEPMPAVPPSLGKIHFAFEPDLMK